MSGLADVGVVVDIEGRRTLGLLLEEDVEANELFILLRLLLLLILLTTVLTVSGDCTAVETADAGSVRSSVIDGELRGKEARFRNGLRDVGMAAGVGARSDSKDDSNEGTPKCLFTRTLPSRVPRVWEEVAKPPPKTGVTDDDDAEEVDSLLSNATFIAFLAWSARV